MEKASAKAWTQDEVNLLTKGIVKIPGGTPNRWKEIANFVGTRNMKEVIEKAKELAARKEKAVSQRADEKIQKEQTFQQKKLEAEKKAKEQQQAAAQQKE